MGLRQRYRTYTNNRPGACPLYMCRWTDFSDPEFKGLPWRRRLAWRLRVLADRLDGWVSNAYSGKIPKGCDASDQWDALFFGLGAAQNYLADLAIERGINAGEPEEMPWEGEG